MFKAVKSVIAANNSAWSGLPAFETAFNTYTAKLAQLELLSYNQGFAIVGVSALKDAKREEAAEKAYAMANSISAFAVVTNKVELYNKMKISKWTILKGSRQEALQLVDIVLAKANEFENDLGDFGIDQATIAELQTIRDELYEQLSAPRNAIIERKTITGQIKLLEKDMIRILRLQLDKLMEFLREDNPEFYASYKNARVTIDLKSKHGDNEEGSAETPGYGE